MYRSACSMVHIKPLMQGIQALQAEIRWRSSQTAPTGINPLLPAMHRMLNSISDTRKAMKDKPVVVAIRRVSKPMIFSEFEKDASAIVVTFGVQDQALLDIVSGTAEPSALLPFQMPANMKTVEEQKEDVPFDMVPYVDSEGHSYDFGFGMNWKGVIVDERS